MERLLSKDWKERVDRLNANELLGEVKGKGSPGEKDPHRSQAPACTATACIRVKLHSGKQGDVVGKKRKEKKAKSEGKNKNKSYISCSSSASVDPPLTLSGQP